jgi:hypothetical protein
MTARLTGARAAPALLAARLSHPTLLLRRPALRGLPRGGGGLDQRNPLHRIAPLVCGASGETHPLVVEACLTTLSDERTSEFRWETPTEAEWRRPVLVIAKQFTLQVAGYRDHDVFVRDDCHSAWDIFETLHLTVRRDQ